MTPAENSREPSSEVDHPGPARHQLRVRTSRSYLIPFVVDLGQRNAVFLKRHPAPLLGWLHRLHWRIPRAFPTAAWLALHAFTVLPERDFDLAHSVNAVPILKHRPYIVTFEGFLPHLPEDRYSAVLHAWLRRRLLRPACVALVAMSEYALRQFRWQNRGFPALDRLERKVHLIYPAVPLRRTIPKPASGDTLKLLFVGRQFMRKGGPALLRAHERLRRLGVPVETTVISTLGWGMADDDYVGPESVAYVHRELERLRLDGVIHRERVPNQDVLALMAEADYLVAPTLHDTFGFASIEALACGTPVIATNTCAQPEIIEPGRSGYLVPIDNEAHVGRWTWLYRNHEPGYLDRYASTVERLGESLTDTLARCWDRRAEYEALSAGAIDRVRSRFDQVAARDRLERLYEIGGWIAPPFRAAR